MAIRVTRRNKTCGFSNRGVLGKDGHAFFRPRMPEQGRIGTRFRCAIQQVIIMSELPPGQSRVTDAVKPNPNLSSVVPRTEALADGSSDAVREQCRADRTSMLREWDAATEVIFADYEAKTLAIRAKMKDVTAEIRQKLLAGMQPLIDEADNRRITVLQKFDTIKDEPGTWKKKDDRIIKTAYAEVVGTIDVAKGQLNQQSITLQESADDIDACKKVSVKSPDSMKQSVKTLGKLGDLARQALVDADPGLTGSMVRRLLFPVFGILVGALAAVAVWFLTSQSILAVLALVAPLALGVGAHFVFAGPLRSNAETLAVDIADIADAAHHVAAKGLRISSSTHQLELDDLARQRDQKLQAIDDWLKEEEELRRQGESVHHAELIGEFDSQLDQLDVDFAVQLSSSDDMMRKKADKLAVVIGERLAAISSS